MQKMKIQVAGSGYTGIANAVFLAQSHEVRLVKTEEVPQSMLEEAKKYGVDLASILTDRFDPEGADFVVICIPVSYDGELNQYDLRRLDGYLTKALTGSEAVVIVRADVPIGYTARMKARFDTDRIVCCPDFVREGRALYDAFHPSRIIVGDMSAQGAVVGELLQPDPSVEVICMQSAEAESVKLFANCYLAMRVAYFNELDTFAEMRGMDAAQIIRGVSSDPRVGNLYNNPSFGYGGRYLVEGSEKLRANFADIPHKIVHMVEVSNEIRKDHVAEMIMKRQPKVVGVYGLSMKTGSKDFRYSTVEGIIMRLQSAGINTVVYEPMIDRERFLSARVITDLDAFKAMSDVIVANRLDEKLDDVMDKVYSRDLFRRD
ncbi:MAG: nucleotide sugar dehydrogenase [Anaerovoracaceae bacterium]